MQKIYLKLIAVLLALLVSVAMVIVSSYAWLVLAGNPAVTGIQVAIGGGNTILMAPNVREKGIDGVEYNIPGRFSDKLKTDTGFHLQRCGLVHSHLLFRQ